MGACTRAVLVALACGLGACLVRHAPPDLPRPEGAHETRRRFRPDGSLESEVALLVFPDGRTERDGPEREYHRDGTLAAERSFARDVPTGLWRTWHANGVLRSEVDFGPPHSRDLRPSRFWHPDGSLAAEGSTRAGVREGPWVYYAPEGGVLRAGPYQEGLRHGAWVFYRAGRKEAEGRYERGQRVGTWTLWDAAGSAHTSVDPPPEEAAVREDSSPRR